MRREIRRALGLFMILAVALAFSFGSMALSGGPKKNDIDPAMQGCSCHGPVANTNTVITVTGLPETYEAEKEYTVTITSTTDVEYTEDPPMNYGGFHLSAAAGTLSAGSGSGMKGGWFNVGSNPPWIEHSSQGEDENVPDASGVQKWEVKWKAPKSGDVLVKVWVNRVNGNGDPDAGDHWNTRETTVKGPSSGGGGKSPGFEVYLGVVALAAALAWAARRRF